MRIRVLSALAGLSLAVVAGTTVRPALADADFTPPTVNMDAAAHFVSGGTLSDSGTTPRTSLKFAWTQYDASGICGETARLYDYSTNSNTPVATFTGVRTTYSFTGYATHYYGLDLKVTDCSTQHNVTERWAYSSGTLQQQNAATYNAGWVSSNCSCFSQGSVFYATKTGRTASFQYSGPAVALITNKASNRGTADIYIDGVKKATINATSSTAINRYVGFTSYLKGTNEHTLEVVVRTGRFDVDGFLTAY